LDADGGERSTPAKPLPRLGVLLYLVAEGGATRADDGATSHVVARHAKMRVFRITNIRLLGCQRLPAWIQGLAD